MPDLEDPPAGDGPSPNPSGPAGRTAANAAAEGIALSARERELIERRRCGELGQEEFLTAARELAQDLARQLARELAPEGRDPR